RTKPQQCVAGGERPLECQLSARPEPRARAAAKRRAMSLALGLVGCGGMGRRHVLGMARLKAVGRLSFDLAAVCDVLPESVRAAADVADKVLGRRPQVFSDFEALAQSGAVDAIIVTTTPE